MIEAANRHSFEDLVSWLNRLTGEFPALRSKDMSARQIAISECISEADKKYGDEAYKLADKANDVWVKVTMENFQELADKLQQRT